MLAWIGKVIDSSLTIHGVRFMNVRIPLTLEDNVILITLCNPYLSSPYSPPHTPALEIPLFIFLIPGKSGIVAERLSASLASTGTPSHYVHAAEWTHGDLGRARHGDVAVFLSHSGNTKECVAAAELLKDRGITVLSIVGKYGNCLFIWVHGLKLSCSRLLKTGAIVVSRLLSSSVSQ